MRPVLEFTPNPAGEAEGFRDAGVEIFRDRPFGAVAREVGQNSRDARAGDHAVVMFFERKLVNTDNLPSIAQYREAVERCLGIARDTGDEKELEFFLQARKVLKAPKLPVLVISDYHTTGLRGPCEPGTPFHALVKSTGISSKENDTSGGSFGIGKSAVYAASDIQTAFYSTLWNDEQGRPQFLAQGKTRLRSFRDAAGKDRRSVGYWGIAEGFMPVSDQSLVPDWMRRIEVGTTICAIAMREAEDWQYEIIASVVQNFFGAIHRREMGFDIAGVQVTDKTLFGLFRDERVLSAAKAGGDDENFEFAKAMYECLTSEDATVQHVDVPSVGRFTVRLQCRDGLPKRIGIIRNGMYITDNLAHFGDKFLKFPMYRDFVAIVEPFAEPENKWLKRMENPRHDDLSADRIVEPAARQTARESGRLLAGGIRDVIKAIARSIPDNETDLDELSEFFASDEKGREDEKGYRDPTTIRVNPAPVRKRKQPPRPPSEGPGEQGGGAQGDGTTEEPGGGGGAGAGAGGTGAKGARRPLAISSPRTLVVDGSGLRQRQVIFTPAESGTAHIRLEGLGLSETETLAIEGGPLKLKCEAGQRISHRVSLSEPYGGPIQIVGWFEGGEQP
jgi:hypothetical protein